MWVCGNPYLIDKSLFTQSDRAGYTKIPLLSQLARVYIPGSVLRLISINNFANTSATTLGTATMQISKLWRAPELNPINNKAKWVPILVISLLVQFLMSRILFVCTEECSSWLGSASSSPFFRGTPFRPLLRKPSRLIST